MTELSGVDLHMHSSCSDGALSPAALVASAAAAGVRVLSLTDHDSIDGLAEAGEAARERGLRFIPGVELSASWRGQDIHVLGYDFDAADAALGGALAAQVARRSRRMDRICDRLGELGLPGHKIRAAMGGFAAPSRAHLARHLVQAGYAASADDAFRRFLRGTAAVTSEWPAIDAVIGWICAAGGFAVLAHPARYALSSGARRQLVGEFAAAGGAALEVVSGAGAAQHRDVCARLALEHGLAGTVGSDFHDPKITWNPLGRSLKLPDYIPALWHRFGR
jgi:3',5'-nucleoside bisphosphate phosphatase